MPVLPETSAAVPLSIVTWAGCHGAGSLEWMFVLDYHEVLLDSATSCHEALPWAVIRRMPPVPEETGR